MSDVDGGAAAPAEVTPVADAEVVHTPNAITTEAPVKPPSIDDALDKAEAKVKAEPAKETPAPVKSEAKAEAKPEPKAEAKADTKAKPEAKTEPVKVEPKRDEAGKYASDKPAEEETPAKVASDPPARFSEDAKAIWKDAPEPLRRETERAIKELTDGHAKYKAKAERDDSLAEFHDMAAKGGTDVRTALTKYVNMENLLRSPNPIKGLEAICDNLGISLKDMAAQVLNRTPEQETNESAATIRELKQRVEALTEQVGGVTKTFETQRHETTHAEVTKFASDPAHSRFDELADDIAFFLKTRTKDLSEAYSLAERLNPAPAKPTTDEPASTASIDLVAQTQKGSKSINGAPGNGSTPNARKSKSLDESVDRAFARFG